jgi:hypothetical protein
MIFWTLPTSLKKMTTEQPHPMVPPLELLQHWEELHFDEGENYDVMLIQAYQAGADRELDECCEWLSARPSNLVTTAPELAEDLHAARRPKLPSLKEQALDQLRTVQALLQYNTSGFTTDTIRRALEALSE